MKATNQEQHNYLKAKAKEAAAVSSAKAVKDTGGKTAVKEPEKKMTFKEFFGV